MGASKSGYWASALLLFSLTLVVGLNSQANEVELLLDAGGRAGSDAIESAYTLTAELGQVRVWRMTGPFGGDVASLAIDPHNSDHILAGTHHGQIYRSTDGGVRWRRVRPGIGREGFALRVILFDRARPGVIFVGANQVKDAPDDATGGGVFRSEDGGESWHELVPLQGRSVRGLVQSAKDPNVFVVAARDGIYRSLDHGATWRRITPESDAELRGFHSVAIDPRDIETIYAGTWHLPWKTTDGGKSWKLAGSKETGMLDDSDIFAIQIDETNPDVVLMSACSGIYRSMDGGKRWRKIQGIPYTSRRTHVIYQHPTRPEVIFAGTTEGLWRTTDGGQNWSLMTPRRLVINAIAIHPSQPDRVLLGTDDMGILISNDGGENYELSNAGFIHRQVRVVLADRTERGRVYAGVIFDGINGGLFISEDGGISWEQSMKGMGVRDVYSLYQSESNPAVILAGTNHGLFRSEDHGRNWEPVKLTEASEPAETGDAKLAAPIKRVAHLRPKKTSRQVISRKKQSKKQPPQSRLSPKPELQPNQFIELQTQVFAIAPLTPRHEAEPAALIAATWDGLFITTDVKRGWKQLKLPLSSPSNSTRQLINTVATSPHAPGLILAGTEEGLFVSHDNGESFTPMPLDQQPRRVRVIAIDPRTADIIYVGTTNGFFRSTDGGRSWEQRGGGMRLMVSVSTLTLNPQNPDELYLGDYLQGSFFYSPDRGKNWYPLDTSALPSSRFWSLMVDPFDGNRLYAGSLFGGVYVMTRESIPTGQ